MRTLVTFAIFAALAWFLAVWIPPHLAVAVVPEGYRDMARFREGERHAYDPQAALRAGDIVALRAGSGVAFAAIAGLPGDEVQVRDGKLLVNATPVSGWAAPRDGIPDRGPIIIPARHRFLISTGHQHDSLAHGPIPDGLVLGRIGDPP